MKCRKNFETKIEKIIPKRIISHRLHDINISYPRKAPRMHYLVHSSYYAWMMIEKDTMKNYVLPKRMTPTGRSFSPRGEECVGATKEETAGRL